MPTIESIAHAYPARRSFRGGVGSGEHLHSICRVIALKSASTPQRFRRQREERETAGSAPGRSAAHGASNASWTVGMISPTAGHRGMPAAIVFYAGASSAKRVATQQPKRRQGPGGASPSRSEWASSTDEPRKALVAVAAARIGWRLEFPAAVP